MSKPEKVKDNFKEIRNAENNLKKVEKRISNVESKINQLERDIKAIDVELEINYEEASSKPNFFDEYQKMKTDLQALMILIINSTLRCLRMSIHTSKNQ